MAIVDDNTTGTGYGNQPGSTPTGNKSLPDRGASGGGMSLTEAINILVAQGWSAKDAYNYLTTGTLFPEDASSGGGGGGGGYVAGPDHFFDVNPLDQAKFDYQREQDAIQNELIKSQQELDKLIADRDYAIKIGDQNLARQRQSDINHWEEVNANLQARAQDVSLRGQSLDFASQMAAIEGDRNRALMEFNVGMANATNDAERNQIQDKWNEQQAHLAVMEDNTRKAIAGLESQINQFEAETSRMVGMGQLGIEHNRFILDAAKQPSNLPAMFLMQRGKAPDFETLIREGEGALAQGDALAPVNPFNLYTPKVEAVTDFSLGGESSAPIVSGNVAQGAQGNQFIQNAGQVAQQSDPVATAKSILDYVGGAAPPPKVNVGKPATLPEQVPANTVPKRPGSGVALSSLQPGLNEATVDGDIMGSDFTLPAYYDSGKTMPVGRNDVVPHGTKVFVDNATPGAAAGTGAIAMGNVNLSNYMSGFGANPVKMLQRNTGYVNQPGNMRGMPEPYPAPVVVGDDPSGVDNSRREVAVPMLDRWGRPAVSVQPMNPEGIMAQIQAFLSGNAPPPDMQAIAAMFKNYNPNYGPNSGVQMQPYQPPATAVSTSPYDPVSPQSMQIAKERREAQARAAINTGQQTGSGIIRRNPTGGVTYIPGAAAGTDVMQQYADQGLGGFYIQESGNPGIDPSRLPPALKALYDIGFPIPPALLASATGGVAPNLSMQRVFNQRGLGSAPSLQTLAGQTTGENELFKGYVESVGKVPFQDFIDWLRMPTANLKTAQVAGRNAFIQ